MRPRTIAQFGRFSRTVRVDVAVPERVRFADGSLDVMGGDFFGGEDCFGMEFVGYPGEFGFGEQQPTTVVGLIAQIKRAHARPGGGVSDAVPPKRECRHP